MTPELSSHRATLLPAATLRILRAVRERVGVRPEHSPSSAEESDDPLLGRFLARDAEALKQIQDDVTRVVRFRGYGIDADDQTDIVQEALLHIWREASRPDFAYRRDFGIFVRLVAARRALDWRRASKLRQPISDEIPDRRMGPGDVALQNERARLARQVLTEIKETCREIIRLHVHESHSYKEMAARLGRTEGSLRTQMWECLKEAREIAERLSGSARAYTADGRQR